MSYRTVAGTGNTEHALAEKGHANTVMGWAAMCLLRQISILNRPHHRHNPSQPQRLVATPHSYMLMSTACGLASEHACTSDRYFIAGTTSPNSSKLGIIPLTCISSSSCTQSTMTSCKGTYHRLGSLSM